MIDDDIDEEVEIVDDEENELHYSVEGLGQFHEIEGQKLFVKTDDCVHCIHDIQLSLRKEDGRKVDKYLGLWQTLEKRLVPLFLHYREEPKIWNGVLKLLVILTRPIQKGTPDLALHLKFLQDYKEALNTQDMFITLMSILMDAVSHNEQADTQIREIETQISQLDKKDSAEETQPVDEESQKIEKKRLKREKELKKMEIRILSDKSKNYEKNCELVLTLIRHILEIPDPKPGDPGYTQSRGCLQIQLIKHLCDEEVLDLLVMFAEQIDLPKFRHLNWLFFEIFYHVCATIPPTELANYDELLKVDLSRLLDVEKKLVYAQVPRYSRHSRFANSQVLKNILPCSGGSLSVAPPVQKIARNRFYRDKASANPEQVNLFQDPSFIDIVNSGDPLLPSSILGKDYRTFYSDIKMFIDQFLDSVFPQLMKSVYGELESEKNMQDFDSVRVLNIITWILDYQCKMIRKNRKKPPTVVGSSNVPVVIAKWATSQDALNFVTVQVKQHSKEAKTIRGGGANLVVALRALLQLLQVARLLGPSSADSYTILDSLSYDEVYRNVTWTIRNYKPTAHRPELLGFAIQCAEEYIKLVEVHFRKLVQTEKKQKPVKPVKPQKTEELRGIEFYDPGHSDSDVSINTSSSEDEDLNFKDSIERGKETAVSEICHGEAIGNIFHILSMYRENTNLVNDSICALILRIINENEFFVAFFFQLSLLIIIYNIINDPSLRAVEEERQKFDSVILICKLIIKRFISVARTNKLLFVEILFPRLKSKGHLLSMESDLQSICSNYSDEESRIILERIHLGDTYEDLKAQHMERAKYAQPWTEDEDQQLIGLWEHVKEMDGKSNRDRIDTVIANTVPLEGKRKRRFKDVKLRLISLGLLLVEDDNDETDTYSSDQEYRHNGGSSSPSTRSERSAVSEDDDNPVNFQEYVKRVNAVKISDKLTSMFDNILALNMGLDDNEQRLLGTETTLKFLGA